MKTILKYLKPYYVKMFFAMLCKFLEAVAEISLPFLMATLIDKGIVLGNQSIIIKYAIIMLSFTFLGYGFALICQYMASRISVGFGKEIRQKVFEKIATMPQSELNKYSQNSLVNRLTNDVRDLQMGVSMFIRLFVRIPPILIGAVTLTIILNWALGLIVLAIIPIALVIIFVIMQKNIKVVKQIQKSLDKLSTDSKDNLVGAREIRVFNRQEKMQQRYFEKCNDYVALQKRSIAISSYFTPLVTICISFAILLVLYFGGVKVASKNLEVGDLTAIITYLNLILTSIITFSYMVVFYVKAVISSDRLEEVMLSKSEVFGKENIEKNDKPMIAFCDVCFSYSNEGEDEIINQTFEVNEGEYVAIVGKTASGKTTIANLLQRLYKVCDGKICIYGKNINDISRDELAKFISHVEQKPSLFAGTIQQNVCNFADEIDEERLNYALEVSQSTEFVQKLEGKEKFVLTRNANNLSGGQKQRLQIARGIYSQSPVKVFDDCFYALDDVTQSKVLQNIQDLPCAKIILTQRGEYVKNADKIIVTNYGKIVDIGKYDELKARCEKFSELL